VINKTSARLIFLQIDSLFFILDPAASDYVAGYNPLLQSRKHFSRLRGAVGKSDAKWFP
jgi:hypothetical protein